MCIAIVNYYYFALFVTILLDRKYLLILVVQLLYPFPAPVLLLLTYFIATLASELGLIARPDFIRRRDF